MELHNIEPVFDERSRILILGSFPSVRSRQQRFFYGHPRNRFWKVMAAVTGSKEPVTIEEKKELLLNNGIALWDVIAQCDITGSADSSISNVTANDLSVILDHSPIERILCNGATAHKLYESYLYPLTGRQAVRMPSTSPANAAWSADRLAEVWGAGIRKRGQEE
ncbi:MAG: DNA-deoxyinosine glycosylase [Erysipelotrichaceae bacterium]|nr:DNA-deoxyinosine glycosylase [Erysipelotrichaceae bacterium]